MTTQSPIADALPEAIEQTVTAGDLSDLNAEQRAEYCTAVCPQPGRDIYIVTARAKDRTWHEDESTGAVALGTLKGDALANVLMKAETKSKRRVTLSIAGLGWLDETEPETITRPDAISSNPHTLPEGEEIPEGPTEPQHPGQEQIDRHSNWLPHTKSRRRYSVDGCAR
jgi:hypothetical protein